MREITIDEAVQLALRHNLTIQIERYNPRLFRYSLEGVRAGWEPTFDLTYQHSYDSRPAGPVVVQGVVLQQSSTESESDLLSAGIRGVLPTGLQYDLGSDIFRREQTSSAFPGPLVNPDLDYTGNAAITLRQPLLRNFWTDSIRYNISLGRKNIEISEHLLRFQVMSVIHQVHLAYYDLIFARENVVVQQAALELAERLVADNRRREEVGMMTDLEGKQSESRARITAADLIQAKSQVEQRENALKRLMADRFDLWINVELVPAEQLVAVPRAFDIYESLAQGMEHRPDLKQFALELEKRDITLKFQKNQMFPVLDLIGSYGYNALDGTFGQTVRDFERRENPSWSYGVVVSVPLGNRAATTRYRANKDERLQALLQYKSKEVEILASVSDAINAARSNLETVAATREARQYAEAALEAEQKKLENGKSTSFAVLQFQRDLTDARFREIQALANYNKAVATLEFNEGTILMRHNIEVEPEPYTGW